MKWRGLGKLALLGVIVIICIVGAVYLTDFFKKDGVGTFDYTMPDEVRAEKAEPGDFIYTKEDGTIKKISGNDTVHTVGDNNTEGKAAVAAHIIIPKLSEDSIAELEDEYINRRIRLTVNNSLYAAYNKDMVLCDKPVVKGIEIKDVCPPHGASVSTLITIDLDGVYEYNLYEENNKYIIDMADIHSVYDKVIVVDAGHGGGDTGCGSCDSKHYEKDITLSIVKLLKERLDETDIKVYYTRLEDETVYLKPRVALANAVKADMFISIHCNYYDRYPAYKISGTETLYSSVNKKMKMQNKQLAKIMMNEFTSATSIKKRSVINRKKDLFILKKSRVPTTIVEMAYLSNVNDLKHFVNEKKIKKVVDGLYNGIVEAYGEMYGKTVSPGVEDFY